MAYNRKHPSEFIVDHIRPELSYRIADFLKSQGGPYDLVPHIKWASPKEMEMLQTWMDHLKSIDKPYVVTEHGGSVTLWKKL